MSNHGIKRDHDSNPIFPTYPSAMTNMSVVPQHSARPNTLPINAPRFVEPSLFTPSDQGVLGLSTPDLINALASQPFTDLQPSPSARALDEILHAHAASINPSFAPLMPAAHLLHPHMAPVTHEPVRSAGYKRSSSSSHGYSSRDRTISSSLNDNDSSTSADSPSPMGSYGSSKRVKDELQHVPSVQAPGFGEEQHDMVKREKKRERNRQAAQKCRTRKLTRIAELQKRVNDLQGKNKDLTGVAETLKTDINKLEKQLQDHHTQGCTLLNGSML